MAYVPHALILFSLWTLESKAAGHSRTPDARQVGFFQHLKERFPPAVEMKVAAGYNFFTIVRTMQQLHALFYNARQMANQIRQFEAAV